MENKATNKQVTKRTYVELDPDYEDVTDQQAKRQRVLEQDGKSVV